MSLKQERTADRIREILSSLLLIDVTDPALHDVTVTSVELDAELEYANVYVNALGDESRQKEVLRGLARANGYLRRELGKRIQLRRAPYLRFHWDTTLQQAEQIDRVFRKIGPIPPPDPEDTTEPAEDTDSE
jgi:ribosome-binding factor A